VVIERAVRHRASDPLEPTGRTVGIDLGVTNMVATSDSVFEEGEHFGSKAQHGLARAQRSLATKQLESKRRRRQVEEVARLHRKIKNQRCNFAHQLSRQLVNEYDFIAYEDLKIAKMVSTPTARPDRSNRGRISPMAQGGKPDSIDQSTTRLGAVPLLSDLQG